MRPPFLPDELSTDRLLLRRPVKADFADLFGIYSDIKVAHWLNWLVYSNRELLAKDIQRYDELWKSGEEYYWVIELCDASSVIGSIACGVSGADADIGFMLHTDYHGNGYATEAAARLLQELKTTGGIDRVVALSAVGNDASFAVLERIGMQRRGVAPSFMVCPNISDEARDAMIYSLDCKI